MTDIEQLKREASDLRKAGNHAEALSRFECLWTQHRDHCSEWEGWGYAQCLQKMKRFAEGLRVSRAVLRQYPDFQRNRNVYGWCLYHTALKQPDDVVQANETPFLQAAEEIIALTAQEQYSPYEFAALRVLRYLKNKNLYPFREILRWTSYLDPARMSTEPNRYETDDGEQEGASPREQWYGHRTKALFADRQYELCIETCQKALDELPSFHSDNDLWFNYRIAQSYGALGEHEPAIDRLRATLKFKREWFVYHSLAEQLLAAGDVDGALACAADAALAQGDSEKKWRIYLLLGQILSEKGEIDAARQHVGLAAKLRVENEWSIPGDLHEQMTVLQVDVSVLPPSKEMIRKLLPMWDALTPRLCGQVEKLLPNGRAGFIRGDDGKSYYFKFREYRGKAQLDVGLAVSFVPVESYDQAKQQDSLEAIRIRPVN